MGIPEELKYTREHEWLRMDGNEAVFGISAHAQEALGDIVFVELPEIGRNFDAEESICVVESVKAVSDVYAPAAGEITGVNEALEATPELVNSDPYNEGWIARFKLAEGVDLSGLMDAEAYAAYLEE